MSTAAAATRGRWLPRLLGWAGFAAVPVLIGEPVVWARAPRGAARLRVPTPTVREGAMPAVAKRDRAGDAADPGGAVHGKRPAAVGAPSDGAGALGTPVAHPDATQDGAASPPSPDDAWGRVLQEARRDEHIETLGERADRRRRSDALLLARRERGVRLVINAGFGFGLGVVLGGGTALGDWFSAGVGLRHAISLRWDLQSRLTLGIMGASPFAFTARADVTFRVHGLGLSGRRPFFGFGSTLGILHVTWRPDEGDYYWGSGYATRSYPSGTLYGGGVLEVGGLWGHNEAWELAWRTTVAGGGGLFFDTSLVLGWSPSFGRSRPAAAR